MKKKGELRDLIGALNERAAEVVKTKTHIKVKVAGKTAAVLPSTPSEYRGLKNQKLALERAGLIEKRRLENGEKRGKRPTGQVTQFTGQRLAAGRIPRRRG